MIMGGNFVGVTQVLTTAISVQINFGDFSIAMAYGIILIAIVIVLALTISLIERLKDEEGNLSKIYLVERVGRRLKI